MAAAFVLVGSGPLAHEGLDARIEAVTRQLETTPRRAWLYARRAELFRQHHDTWNAWNDLRRVRLLDPELVELPLVEARLLRDEGRAEEALEVVDELMGKEPTVGRAHVLRAELLVASARPREAVTAYDQALARVPPSPDLYLARAALASSPGVGSPADALAGLDEGLRRLGQVPALVLASVDLERRRGSLAGALERIRRAGPSLAPQVAARLEGDLLGSFGRTQAARAAYQRALRRVAELPPEKRRARSTRELVARVRAALAVSSRASGSLPSKR